MSMRYTIQTNVDGRTYNSYDYANKNDAWEDGAGGIVGVDFD